MKRVKSSPRRSGSGSGKLAGPDRVVVQNVNVPGYTTTLERPRYETMKRALLKVLPTKKPGLTQTEMRHAVLEHLPGDLFPGGAKAGWWAKSVQLDLEAKGIVTRDPEAKPLRWIRRPG